MDLPFLEDDSGLSGERLSLRWVAVSRIPELLWEDNPKSHDIGLTWESIVTNGFADPAKWDTNLKNLGGGQGALVYGNGRCEAVWWGFNQYRQGLWKGEIPRGINTDPDGNWYIQVKFGIDARSEAAAAAFAVDHNILTISGGDYDIAGTLAMFDKKGLAKVWQKTVASGESLLTLDEQDLAALIELLNEGQGDSTDTSGASDTKEVVHTKLAERFLIPPFSVLDARQGYWQERKRLWLSLGIQSELGRGADITYGDSPEITGDGLDFYRNSARQNRIKGKTPADSGGNPLPIDRMKNGKRQPAAWGQDLRKGEHTVGQPPETASLKGGLTYQKSIHPYDETGKKRNTRYEADMQSNLNNAPALPLWATQTGTANMASGTSIFDPVLCELAYTWFTPKGAHILDPFSGGSVRGIVASYLSRSYTGVDLREEQIEANIIQGAELSPENPPIWIAGDSVNIQSLAPADYDFLFTCPPYADLEIYSEDERDISNMDYPQFLEVFRQIIRESCAMLRENRFACIVVGDIRDKRGNYRNFVSDTIQAFLDCGLSLYNEAILVTSVGSLPIRAGKQFAASRKLGKTHQNVLTFIKGDARAATEYCGDIDVYVPDEGADEFTEDNEGDNSDYGERLILS